MKNEHLIKGIRSKDVPIDRNLLKLYAQYSDMYSQGMLLNNDIIKSIYRMEVMKIKRNNMGIWQLHALSSVLKCPIFSVYPTLGNINVRRDLNRLIMPRTETSIKMPIYILWKSTRDDMVKGHWIPNHFVPLVPIYAEDIKQNVNVGNCHKAEIEERIVMTCGKETNGK